MPRTWDDHSPTTHGTAPGCRLNLGGPHTSKVNERGAHDDDDADALTPPQGLWLVALPELARIFAAATRELALFLLFGGKKQGKSFLLFQRSGAY